MLVLTNFCVLLCIFAYFVDRNKKTTPVALTGVALFVLFYIFCGWCRSAQAPDGEGAVGTVLTVLGRAVGRHSKY